jgi:hypothetical protein
VTYAWQATKDGRVRISWRGKVVTTLTGAQAARFLRDVEGAGEEAEQLAMARVTGNFKRGNERR